MVNAISTANLQFLLLLGVILLIWLFFRFVAPRVLDWLTPESEKRERTALVANVKALQALTVEEARERMTREVLSHRDDADTDAEAQRQGTERGGWMGMHSDAREVSCHKPQFTLASCPWRPPLALPPAVEGIFSRFEKIEFADAAAELSRERLRKWDEDFVEIGEGEDSGTFLVKLSSGEVFTVWSGEGRRVREKDRFAPSLYHAILLLGGAAQGEEG